ncbi:MAG: NAD(P)H-binding protein [Halodesulfurarchaeum sp.]
MRVLVTGATGFVGSRLVSRLADGEHSVRALVRDPSRYEGPDGVDVYEGDVLEPETLDPALEGVDAAFYLIHAMDAPGEFADRDRRMATTFAEAVDRAGVERVLYLGGLGAEGADLSEHLRSRREVERVLGESAAELTVLRAAIIVGAGSASFQIVIQLASRLPLMITPAWVRTPCQPIAIEDVLAYLEGALAHPETAGETYEIGGPDVLTYQEMLRRTADLLDRRLVIVPVPVLTPRLSAYWVDLVTDVPASIAHPLIEGLKNPVVVSDHRIEDVIPLDRTPFEEAARSAVRDWREER